MAIRIPWDEHEEAILLQALINVLNHTIERKRAISDVSKQLRELAAARGIAIDEKFRNENGITLQMSKLEYVFTDGVSGLRVETGWYFDIVKIYKESPLKYRELLEEIMDMSVPDKAENMSFSVWIKKNNPTQADDILSSLNVMSILLRKNRTIQPSILQITDIEEIESLIGRIRSNKGINIHSEKKRNAYITALSAYKDYLQYLENGNTENKYDSTVEESRGQTLGIKDGSSNETDTGLMEVSFAEERSYSYTRPSDLEYSGTHYSVRNWTQAYVQLVKCLFEDYPDKIASLKGKSIRGRGRIDVADTSGSDAMLDPREIAEDLYLETNESADAIVEKNGMLLKLCAVDFDDVKITYASTQGGKRKTESAPTETKQKESKERKIDGLSFYDWLVQTQGMAEDTGRSYDSAINTADTFARENNIGHGMIRGTMDFIIVSETADALFQTVEFIELNQRQHNRFRAALRKYLQYIRGDSAIVDKRPSVATKENFENVDFTPYREILLEKFPKGFRIESRLDMGRFRAFWKDMHRLELAEDDEAVRKRIAHITVRCQDFVYLPEMMMAEHTAQRLLAYITECFKAGKMAVYFDALYKEFQLEFIGRRINNPEMLKSYLAYMNDGRYYISKNYLIADAHAEVNPTDEVRDYLITEGIPVTVEDLKEALSHINEAAVFGAVAGHNSAEFVRNQKGEYFHADIVHFTKQEIDTIAELIQSAIDDKEYMGGKELTDAVIVKLPAIMERYPFLTWLGLRGVIAYKLQDVFSFRGKIISAYGQDLSMSDVFAHFAATRDHFTLEKLNSLKRDLDTPIYFDSVYANSLRINKDEFVSRDQVSFDTEATDAAISRFCTGDYIALKEISFFGSFPDAGFPWNGFLLEHYVADFSKKFKLLHIGFTAGTPVGAIVKRSSRFDDFDELVSAELAVSKIPLNRENALQYLVDIGLLARRNYRGIEQTLSRAKLQRSKKG